MKKQFALALVTIIVLSLAACSNNALEKDDMYPESKIEDTTDSSENKTIDIDFYDENGEAIAYCDNGEEIYLYSGELVAIIDPDNIIYSIDDEYLGWYKNGWVIDDSGDCVFYTDEAEGGPSRPSIIRIPGSRRKNITPRPATIRRPSFPPSNPVFTSKWSKLSASEFFKLDF